MSTEQTPEVAYQPSDMGSDSHSAPSQSEGGDNRNEAGGDLNGDGRVDNREFRRNRNRECYCRGRNKSCPKCQGTGQLLPNWRENLNAARGTRPQGDPQGAVGEASTAVAAPREQQFQPAPQQGRDNYAPRDNRGDNQRDGYNNRDSRQQRWQERRPDGGRNNGRNNGGRNNGGNQQGTKGGKTCPMCGEFVPNLRQHVLARHDD